MNQERTPILKPPMKKHPIKRIAPTEKTPRPVALLMRRQGIERKAAEWLIEMIVAMAEDADIGAFTNAQIAAKVEWHGPPSDLIDDLVAAHVLRWDEEKELALAYQEDE